MSACAPGALSTLHAEMRRCIGKGTCRAAEGCWRDSNWPSWGLTEAESDSAESADCAQKLLMGCLCCRTPGHGRVLLLLYVIAAVSVAPVDCSCCVWRTAHDGECAAAVFLCFGLLLLG